MNQAATRAPQRKPHGTGAKPRAMVTHRPHRPAPRTVLPSPSQAEGLALRATARLCADSATPAIRAQHRTYMDGFVAALQAAGLLADHRAIVLRTACHHLLDGQITPGDYDAMQTAVTDIDPGYVRAVQHVRRARTTTVDSLADALGIGRASARQHIAAMVEAGVINQADMFGVHTLHAVEVAHG